MNRLTVSPELTTDVLNALAAHRIYTVNNFLTTDVDKLSAWGGLEVKVVLVLKRKFARDFSAPILNGKELYLKRKQSGFVTPTLISRLDEVLGGGLKSGHIYEICGPPGAGKTQLCLNIVAKLGSVENGCEILYVDTKGDFTAHRLYSLLHAIDVDEKCMQVMERINVVSAPCLKTLIGVLDGLKTTIRGLNRLIVIDSISTLYYPHLGTDSKGVGLLSFVGSMLNFLASDLSVTVLVTNLGFIVDKIGLKEKYSYSGIKPAMGKHWAHVAHSRLIIQRARNEIKLNLYEGDSTVSTEGVLHFNEKGVTK